MPFVLSPMIDLGSPGMWYEGDAYTKKNIYSIEPGKMPPVNYDEHILRSHSLTHLETPAHTQNNGNRLEYYYSERSHYFYGRTLVLRLTGNNYKDAGNGIHHWQIEVNEIQSRLNALNISTRPSKILITTDNHPENPQGYHDPNYVLTLTQEAADFLVNDNSFHLYGTSWKSSDYNPGSVARPIHDTLFTRGIILENLKLKDVPEGIYFMTAYPIPFINASESPVVPVLFSKDEILASF